MVVAVYQISINELRLRSSCAVCYFFFLLSMFVTDLRTGDSVTKSSPLSLYVEFVPRQKFRPRYFFGGTFIFRERRSISVY